MRTYRKIRERPVLAAMVCVCLALCGAARGGMVPTADDSWNRAFGASSEFGSVIGLQVQKSGGVGYATAFFPTNGYGRFAYTPAHALDGAVSVTGISGANVFTAPTATMSAKQWWIYPTYSGVTSDDFGLIDFGSTFPGITPVDVSSTMPNRYDIVDWAGYGTFGVAGQGLLGQDGYIRGARQRVSYIPGSSDLFNFGPNYIGETFYRTPGGYSLPTEMLATPGDSGSPVLNAQGQVIAMQCFDYSVYQFGDVSGSIMVSPYQDWANQTIATAVPEPMTLYAVLVFGVPCVLLGRRATMPKRA